MTKYGGAMQSPDEYIKFLEGVVAERDSYSILPADIKLTHELARLNAVVKRREKTNRDLQKEINGLEKRCSEYKREIDGMNKIVKFLDAYPEIRAHVEGIFKEVDSMMQEAYDGY